MEGGEKEKRVREGKRGGEGVEGGRAWGREKEWREGREWKGKRRGRKDGNEHRRVIHKHVMYIY